MNTTTKAAGAALSLAAALSAPTVQANQASFPLAGSWTLVAADQLRPDGSRVHDYGAAPQGLLLIDTQGRYSLQIYQSERPRFASGDKKNGTAAEYQSASLGASSHFGTVAMDTDAHTLTFHIEGSGFKNWEGSAQKRQFELKGDELSYQVPARPDGSIPISVWRRLP
jgi:hypothetical protein